MRLMILRHAPVVGAIGPVGRSDPPADCSDTAALSYMAGQLSRADQIWCSPALRCRQTALAMRLDAQLRPLLWEQDFGEWESKPFADLPDLGPLPPAELAAHTPPGGESFNSMAHRIAAQIYEAEPDQNIAMIAHAGTVRAALAMALGPLALSFSVAPLSLTILQQTPAGWAIEAVNRVHHA